MDGWGKELVELKSCRTTLAKVRSGVKERKGERKREGDRKKISFVITGESTGTLWYVGILYAALNCFKRHNQRAGSASYRDSSSSQVKQDDIITVLVPSPKWRNPCETEVNVAFI